MREAVVVGVGRTRLLLHQTLHELVAFVREPLALLFTLVFPLVIFLLVASLFGNATIDDRSGVRVAQFVTPALASYGLVMATFTGLAVALAEAREDGILKRQRVSPLPPWVAIGSRVLAGGCFAFVAVGLLTAAGVALFDVQIVWGTLPATVVTLLVGIACFGALGLALAAAAPTSQVAVALANGILLPLAFVSDIFVVNARLPRWLETLGWVFPLKHLVNAYGDATNPFLDGPGPGLGHLAVLAVWGIAGGILAARLFSVEPLAARHGTRRAGRDAPSIHEADTVPRRSARPSSAALLVSETRHVNAGLWRAGALVFAVGFPVLLVLLVPQIFGPDALLDDGTPMPQRYAPMMALYGAAMVAFLSMPEGLARARERGVLKRLSTVPLPTPVLLGARVASVVCVACITLALVLGVAGVLYGVPVPPTWPGALATFLVATLCFAVLGLALVTLLRSSRSVTAVALGTLLSLSFISGIFMIEVDLPAWLDAIGWAFPLRHAATVLSTDYATGAGGSGFELGHLAVLVAWTLAGLLVLGPRAAHLHRAEPGRRS